MLLDDTSSVDIFLTDPQETRDMLSIAVSIRGIIVLFIIFYLQIYE